LTPAFHLAILTFMRYRPTQLLVSLSRKTQPATAIDSFLKGTHAIHSDPRFSSVLFDGRSGRPGKKTEKRV
jgi:hypothetical protein